MKEKPCKNCTTKFEPTRPLQRVCSPVCAIELSKKQKAKQEKKEWQVKKKMMKEKLKPLGQYEKEARKVFQQWIRKRDELLPCISCNATTALQWDAGHYLKAELFSGLIFNEDNCFKQCSRCNDLLSGNELEYRDGLIKRFGREWVETLEASKNMFRGYKYSREELVEIKKKYQEKLKVCQVSE